MTAFLGAPDAWGLLLRTIDVRPKQLTCITTSTQGIIAACEDTVNIYNAVTGVLQQSLRIPEIVTKIQGSPDGSTLFFAHSFSMAMWDVQTGGLIHTFTTQSRINDIAVSTTGDYIACGLSDGSIRFWNVHTKQQGTSSGDGHPAITICWPSPLELAVITQGSLSVYKIPTGEVWGTRLPGHMWGMVYLEDRGEFIVGILQSGDGVGQGLSSLKVATKNSWGFSLAGYFEIRGGYHGQLLHPTNVGESIACIAPPRGVQVFNIQSCKLTNNPLPLDAATSVAVSPNRKLVAQTKDSIQIFSIDVLENNEVRKDTQPSHVYPLGEKHTICLLQPNRHLAILESETLRELRPDDGPSPVGPLFTDRLASARASFGCGLVAEFSIPAVMELWESGAPLPEWTEVANEDAPLRGWSPECTRVVTVYGSPRRELRVEAAKEGVTVASLPLEDVDLGAGEVYDVTFDSETRFYLKIDGAGRHIQIPHDIIASPSGDHSHTITKGDPVALPEPRAIPPYTLNVNCEWVVDTGSRKICWISPGDIRRGSGSHFWAGLSLVMVGDDGVVRKLSFKEPNS